MPDALSRRKFLVELLCWRRPVSGGRAAVLAAVVLVTSFALFPQTFSADGPVIPDDHAVISLDLAMVRAFCGRASFYSHAGRVAAELQADMSRRDIPLRQLVSERAGSMGAYCAQAVWPRVNNENSLMLLETALLRIRPDLSLSGVGQWLHAIRIVMVTVFVVALLWLGSSLWFAMGTMVIGLIVLNAMPTFVYSVYPFLFVLILALAGIYGLLLLRPPSTLTGWAATAVGLGALSSFTVNMRTSYLPVVAIFLLTFLAALWWAKREGTSRLSDWRRTLLVAAAFLIGYVAFQWGFITRHFPPEDRAGAAHSVMHPLVLALGVPETDFSRELGVRWDDRVGPEKAQAIDPDTDYLGPRYDAALKTYYRNLWQTRTRDMLQLYRTKFSTAGTEMLTVLRSSPGPVGAVIAALLAPLDWLVQVVWLAVFCLVLALVMLRLFVQRRSVMLFVFGLLSLAAALLQVESGVVYSKFVQQYHNYASFFVLFISLAGVQAAVNYACARWRVVGGDA